MRNYVLIWSLLILVGCSTSAPETPDKPAIELKYSVKVPTFAKKEMIFHPKHDNPYKDNAFKMYKRAHERGWKECLELFRSGKLTKKSCPTIKQQYGLEMDAEFAGFDQCKAAIFKLIDKHGESAVSRALR